MSFLGLFLGSPFTVLSAGEFVSRFNHLAPKIVGVPSHSTPFLPTIVNLWQNAGPVVFLVGGMGLVFSLLEKGAWRIYAVLWLTLFIFLGFWSHQPPHYGLALYPPPFAFGLHVSVGVIMFPVVFIMTDVVGEVYGKQIARYFVLAGFVSTALFIVYSFASLALPWATQGEWVRQGYDQVFGMSLRIAIASLVAYAVGEYQDVVTFFFFKQKWGSRFFWLRSFLSNVWSQLFDTVLFMVIAFAGVYETRLLFNLIISWWLFKVAMGALYTPLSYLGIYLLRERPVLVTLNQ
jgi:uncharacterized integral membrane protein (TIGR00697 family)